MICFSDGTKVPFTRFPDGTIQVWKLPEERLHTFQKVIWEYETLEEFFILSQLFDLVYITDVRVLYYPFARQDKAVDNNNCFGLTTFNRLMDAIPAGIKPNLIVHSLHGEFFNVRELQNWRVIYEKEDVQLKADIYIGADSSAHKHFHLVLDKPYHFFTKKRITSTGTITEMLAPEIEIAGKTVCVLDDIVDGGATLRAVYEILRKQKPKKLSAQIVYATNLKQGGLTSFYDEVLIRYTRSD